MIFRVNIGDLSSSIRYRRCKEGTAKKSRIIPGTIVQIISIFCASRIYRWVYEFCKSEARAKPTKVRTRIITNKARS